MHEFTSQTLQPTWTQETQTLKCWGAKQPSYETAREASSTRETPREAGIKEARETARETPREAANNTLF